MKDPDDRGFDAKSLLIEAKRAAEFAYVPYSSFPVGAAILFEDGSVVSGCNVENEVRPYQACSNSCYRRQRRKDLSSLRSLQAVSCGIQR